VFNQMTGSVGALAMRECKNTPSLLGNGPLKSPAMRVLEVQFDGLRWRCSNTLKTLINYQQISNPVAARQ
jgi:hypothetical protein